MSVLIKGMKMPTRCEYCGFLKVMYEPPRCGWTGTKVLGNGNARLDNCPLVPVPPHGDLIDRDANLMSLRKVLNDPFADHGSIETAMLRACIKVFEEAPTIIPAEEGE